MGRIITVCPRCDSSSIRPRVKTGDYRCSDCKNTFDDPAEREPKLGGFAAEDHDPDPEPGEEADPEPEPQGEADQEPVQTEPDPEPPEPEEPEPPVAGGRPDQCGCCGAAPGNLTRNGMCYGCELSGCSADSRGCSYRP